MGVNFNVISQDAFSEMQFDAGVLLKDFDPNNPALVEADIIGATTGGINISCVPSYSDWGEDVDNCPPNVIELKHFDGWDAKMSTTLLNMTRESLAMSLGYATATPASVPLGTVTPQVESKIISASYAKTIWWVGNCVDGSIVAIEMHRVLSTGGLSFKTTKNGKGQLGLEVTCHDTMTYEQQSMIATRTPIMIYLIHNTQ